MLAPLGFSAVATGTEAGGEISVGLSTIDAESGFPSPVAGVVAALK